MKNRIVALLAVLALTASLTACGGNTAASASTPASSDKAEELQSSAPSTEVSTPAEVQEASVSEPASDVQEAPEPVVYELPLTDANKIPCKDNWRSRSNGGIWEHDRVGQSPSQDVLYRIDVRKTDAEEAVHLLKQAGIL